MWKTILNRLSLPSVLIINVIAPLLIAMGAATCFGLRTVDHVKERFGSVTQSLQSVFHIGRVYGAYVYDAQGKQIAALGAVEPERKKDDLVEVLGDGQRQGEYENIQGKRVYSYFCFAF